MEGNKKLSKEERVAQRRARVAARRNKDDDKFKNGADNDESKKDKASKSKAQITESRQKIDDQTEKADLEVTDIRINRDMKEGARRRKEEENREFRMIELEKELLESTKINREIEMQWAQIAQKNIPQELYQDIAVQYKAASKLLASKDEIIKALQQELKTKDEDYVELLAQHQEDIVNLVTNMKKEFAALLKVCENELGQIENVCVEERQERIDRNKGEIEGLFNKRREMELQILYAKQSREEEFQNELHKIRATDAEDYNSLKVTLENNIQLLEQQLEEMRATYQLNSEKLDYNHNVLEERDSENKQTVEHHRQRLRRLKEALSNHKQRFFKQDAKFKTENHDLTEDFKRITEQFKDLQKKFKHFETVDHNKYREVWKMNEENTMKHVRKLLTADKLIHEQILGLQFMPKVAEKNPYFDPTTVNSAQVYAAYTSTEGNDGNAHPLQETQGGGLAKQLGAAANPDAAILPKGKFSIPQVQAVMALLGGESSFLVDARLKESLRGLSPEEQEMYKIDTILSSLGVEDHEDLDELCGFFYGEDVSAEAPNVHPNDIIKIVRDFVVKRQQLKSKPGEASSTKQAESSVSSEKKARKKERERLFWKSLGDVIPEKTLRMWGALEKSQRKYNDLLEERATLIDETTELARQNEELKILLQEYLGSKINQDLQIPPTRLIRVD